MKKRKAVTLIELLIASSIFVVVMVTIYSAFHSGIFGYRNIEETLNVYQAARQFLERINLDLRNAFAFSKDDTKFAGNENEISFLTLVDRFSEDKIVQEYALISYKLEGNKLLRLCRKNQDSLKENSEVQPEEMASNIEKIIFKYFYIDSIDNTLKERELWDDPKIFPVAVEVSLIIKGKIEQNFQRTVFLTMAE